MDGGNTKSNYDGKNINPNWTLIKNCPMWRHFTTIICDGCDSKVKCWGTGILLYDDKEALECLKRLLNNER